MFDPFDDNNRDRRKRRKHSEVVAERKAWADGIDDAIRKGIEAVGAGEYVQGDAILMYAIPHHAFYYALVKNFSKSMKRLGYIKLVNKKAKDGRWRCLNKSVTLFKKIGAKDIEMDEVKKILQW